MPAGTWIWGFPYLSFLPGLRLTERLMGQWKAMGIEHISWSSSPLEMRLCSTLLRAGNSQLGIPWCSKLFPLFNFKEHFSLPNVRKRAQKWLKEYPLSKWTLSNAISPYGPHFGLWEGREKRRRGGWRGETHKAYQPYLEIKKENLNNGKENDTKF